MGIHYVSSSFDLLNWNGSDSVKIIQSFTINDSIGYPVLFNGSSDIVFEGSSTGSPYIITIDQLSSGSKKPVWNGLVIWDSNTTAMIQFRYLQLNIQNCSFNTSFAKSSSGFLFLFL